MTGTPSLRAVRRALLRCHRSPVPETHPTDAYNPTVDANSGVVKYQVITRGESEEIVVGRLKIPTVRPAGKTRLTRVSLADWLSSTRPVLSPAMVMPSSSVDLTLVPSRSPQ
jgi:hypothetical protein